MWFSRKQVAAGDAKAIATAVPGQVTTKSRGDAAEAAALAHLAQAGLKLIETNYRTPGRGGGEIDLVMRAPDGTLVFVEVRQRSGDRHGGAAASIGAAKQQRIIHAARHYLMRFASPPPCRFDVVLVSGGVMEWLPAAFDAS
jgi:putative endonuclease